MKFGKNAQGDRHVYASRTRFITDGLLGLFKGRPGRDQAGVSVVESQAEGWGSELVKGSSEV